jgi:hypothetical protein
MTPWRLTIHCSDTENGVKVSVDEIRKWHIRDRGWKDIGYHFVIYPDGTVANGRSSHVTGAHVLGENSGNLGVCLNGRDKYTVAQFDSLRTLVERLCDQFDIPTRYIFGHYEFQSAKDQGKTCPNINMDELRRWFVSHDPEHELVSKYILEEK